MNAQTKPETGHSILSPSAAKRWTKCPASLAACKHIPNTTNEKSALGSAKHSLAAQCLTHGTTPDTFIGATIQADGFTFTVNEEFADHVNTYVQGVRALGGDQTYEQWVSSERAFGIPGQGGTLDACASHIYDGVLDIADAKFGYTPVRARDNEQLEIYARCKLDEIDPHRTIYDKVRLHIFQPKLCDLPDTAEYTGKEIDARTEEIAPAARLAYELYMYGTPERIEAEKIPSYEACEWCPIRTKCRARLMQLNVDVPLIPMSPSMPQPVTQIAMGPSEMTNIQLSAALERVDYVERFVREWAESLRAEGLMRAENGTFPGWKVIEGKRGARAVPKADQPLFQTIVAADLGDAAYEKPSFKSPTQLELTYKRLGRLDDWKAIQDGPVGEDGLRRGGWVVQAAGAKALARETDPGAPISAQIMNEFPLAETT